MILLNNVVKAIGGTVSLVHGSRLSILIFHRVLPALDPLRSGEPDAALFEKRMRWLSSAFHVLPLVEAARRLNSGTLPANAACITFDDGYADNFTIAAPILARLRLTATFFISTGFLDGGRMWNDTVIESLRIAQGPVLDLSSLSLGTWPCANEAERAAAVDPLLRRLKYLPQAERQVAVDRIADQVGLPARSDLMMTRQQVRELRRWGMSIGAHTMSHPILTTLDQTAARGEIASGREELEQIIGDRVKTFAYPNGKPVQDYDRSHVKVVKELGFELAVSTAPGVADRRSDRFQLPRFTPWDHNVSRFGARLAQNLLRSGNQVAVA